MEDEVRNLTKDLRDYSSGMAKRVREDINLKLIEANFEADIINNLAGEGKIADPSKLTNEENSLVRRELGKIRNKEVLESVRKAAKDFFDKEQETLEKMQENLNKLEEDVKKESEQVEKDLKALQEKQAAHEEDEKNPELTEDEKKELKELQKKNNYFKNIFPNKLKNMKQKMALARSTIKYQKEALNVECQERFGGFAVRNDNRNQDEQRDEFNNQGERQEPEDKEKKDEEQLPGENDSIVGDGQNRENRQTQGQNVQGQNINPGMQQGGFTAPMGGQIPVNPGVVPTMQQPQQQVVSPTQQQTPSNDAPEQTEHIPTEEEILGEENPILKFNGDSMTVRQALEFIRKYSTFSAEERRKCINAGGLEVIKKATNTLNEKGGSLSTSDKNLLIEYSKTISKSSMEMADLVAKESEKPDAKNPLCNVLRMRTDDPQFKEIREYFAIKKGWFRAKKSPDVVYNYDKIPDNVKELFDNAQKEFEKRQEKAAKEIEELQETLKDPNLSAAEKEKTKESINIKTESMTADKKGFERTFLSVVRAGKALSYTKKIEEMARRVQTLTAERENSEQEPNFEENLHNNTRNDDERAAENKEKVEEKFRENLKEYTEKIQAKIDNGEEVTFEEYAMFNQYVGYGVNLNELPDIDKAIVPEIIGKQKEIDDTFEKVLKIEQLNGTEPTEDMLLSDEEIHLLISKLKIDPKRIGKYASKDAVESYKEKYDLKRKAEKDVEQQKDEEDKKIEIPDFPEI